MSATRVMRPLLWLATWLMLSLATPAFAATVEYLHTDALGSVVAVSNSAGTVIERREYEPYGRQLKPAVLEDGPAYTGHVSDAATGLSYMQQRYYDSVIGRFLSVDPVTANTVSGTNFNRYWYGNSSPYNFTDPDGRQASESSGSLCKNKARCKSVIPINPSGGSTNGWYSSGNVYTSRAAASEAASQHQTNLAGGVWKKHLFGTGYLTFVYEDSEGFGYYLVPYQGGMAPAFGVSKSINITARGLAHVTARHTAGGVRIAGKSVFNAGEDVAALVKNASGAPRVRQAGGNFERAVDAGRIIGIDRATGQPTSVYTVITNAANDLITAFPGRP